MTDEQKIDLAKIFEHRTLILQHKDLILTEPKQEELFKDIPLSIYEIKGLNTGTVQVSKIALAEDGGEYFLKSQNDGDDATIAQLENQYNVKILKEMSPVSEFFCHKVADLCGLPIPQYRILKDRDGNLYFGSLLDKGHDPDQTANDLQTFICEPKSPKDTISIFYAQLWTIYAFDCFFFNTDRHFNNFLILKRNQFEYTQIKPFDFAFSSLSFAGYPYQPMHISETNCNTRKFMKQVDTLLSQNEDYRKFRPNYIEIAKENLNKLLLINQQKIKDVFASIPEEWMTQEQKDNFINWWASDEKRKRIITIQTTELK